MKANRLVVSLICLFGALCLAQESTQKVSRVLPTRLNAVPPPPLPAGTTPPQIHVTPPPPASTLVKRPAPAPATPQAMNLLSWDAELKEDNVKAGEMAAHFTFYFTNTSEVPVVITSAHASCGCTVPKLPSVPWTNAPGATGEIPVTMNLVGKSGTVFKNVFVETDKGQKTLTVKVNIPAPANPPMDRNRNQELAKADRQAVFKGDCARCHAQPTKGRMGKDLFGKACGICHESEHRATMVADLHNLNHDTNADYWKTWISMGKPGSLMPAFAASEGGPLNEAQIDSLVQYLVATIPAQAHRSASIK